MTFYARDDYFYNNKNDALTSDSRPINNSTTYSNSSNNYEQEYDENYVDELAHDNWSEADALAGSFNQSYDLDDYCSSNLDNISSRNGVKFLPNLPAAGGVSGVSGEWQRETATATNGERRAQRYGAYLPHVPANENSRCRLPLACQNVQAFNDLNGHAGARVEESLGLGSGGKRKLPQARSRSSLQRQLFEDNNVNVNSNMKEMQAYGSQLGLATTTGTGTGTSSNYDVFQRPYTSMLPLEYENYSNYSGNYSSDYSAYIDAYNADNLSTYSDTPPSSSSTQHKLQQQRKISLMMAMTTASVIASGETRVPVQKRTTTVPSANANANANANDDFSSYSSLPSYSGSGFSNTAAIASTKWSELTTVTTRTTTTTTTTTAITARKLPKRLPTPQYKNNIISSPITSSASATGAEFISSPTLSLPIINNDNAEKSTRPKQLPKLPVKSAESSEICMARPASLTVSNTTIVTTSASHLSSEQAPHIEHISADPTTTTPSYSANNLYLNHQIETPPSAIISEINNLKPFNDNLWSSTLATNSHSISTKTELPYKTNLQLDSSTTTPTKAATSQSPIIMPISDYLEKMSVKEEASSFDISEYLKPYSYSHALNSHSDSLSSANQLNSVEDHLMNIKTSEPLDLLKYTMPNSITAWSAGDVAKISDDNTNSLSISKDVSTTIIAELKRDETLVTPSNDSFSTLSYSLPLNIVATTPTTLSSTHDPVTTTSSWSKPTSNDVVFTTTVIAASTSSVIVDSSPVISAAVSPTLSYMDYMKKFDLPELPPIPGIDLCTVDKSDDLITDSLIKSTTLNTDSTFNLTTLNGDSTFKATTINDDVYIDAPTKTITTSTIEETSTTTAAYLTAFSTFDEYKLPSIEVESSKIPATIESSIKAANDMDFSQITTDLTDYELPITIATTSEVEPSTDIKEESAIAFDDSFYDSFNVDLSALTATIAHIESETKTTSEQCVNYLPANTIVQAESTSIAENISNSFAPEKTTESRESSTNWTNNQGGYYKPTLKPATTKEIPPLTPPKTPKVVASSVLGGLSKGLKGGLDGVLSGVNLSTEPSASKKGGFGFGLAAKLVPNVGGLLSNKQSEAITAITTPMTTSLINSMTTSMTTQVNNSLEIATTSSTNYNYGYGLEQISTANTTATPTPTNEYLNIYSNGVKPQNDYINNYDELLYSDEVLSVDNSRIAGYEDEYGFSEYPTSYHTSGEDNGDISYSYDEPQFKDQTIMTNVAEELTMGTAEGLAIGYQPSMPSSTLTADQADFKKPSQGVSGLGLGSLLPTTTSTKKSTFGSILGKAAAAVQSATQAVNQGASTVASAVAAQKSAAAPQPLMSALSPPNAMAAPSTIPTTAGYDVILNNDYNHLLINQEESLSPYSIAGADYENSNVAMAMDNKAFANYYSNGNQSQQQESINKGKKLLPSINGKSALLLIKQQPTEIYEDDIIDDVPIYDIESERADIDYNAANGYYEHGQSGYDYREDYFNEEDEYKYLEQQQQQQQQRERQRLAQKQSSLDYIDEGQLEDDDYLEEIYASEEDSGNYLDESSSGSVGQVVKKAANNINIDSNISMSMPVEQLTTSAAAHQQIRKQDSIIMEEEEATVLDLVDDDSHIVRARSPDMPLNEELEDEDDQLAELMPTTRRSQKRRGVLTRGETEEVVSGHMQMLRKPEITARQRWHWAYNKIIMQLNVSAIIYLYFIDYYY